MSPAAEPSMIKRSLGLEYLTVFGLPVLEYVDLAARVGCDFVSLNFAGAANRSAEFPVESLRSDAQLRRAVTQAAQRNGIAISLVEGFGIIPGVAADACFGDLDAAAEMGARSICAISMDKDMARTYDQFAVLAEAAAARGLILTTEVGAGVMRNIEFARQALCAVDHANFTLLLDAMHFFRKGGTIQDLSTLPAAAIGHVQLCDAPMPPRIDNYMEEALFGRCAPGEGDLPLWEFLKHIPIRVPIGLEIPMRKPADADVVLEDRLASIMADTRKNL